MTGTTLLDWIQGILRDPAERAAFQADPDDYADRHGFGDLSPADVHDALWLIADNQSASWEHGTGQVHYPPPPPIHQHADHAGGYLNSYITGSYTGDDRDTGDDGSAHQDVHRDDDHHRDDHHRDDQQHDRGDPRDDEDLWDDRDPRDHADASSAGHEGDTVFGAGDVVHGDFAGSGDDTEFGAGSAGSTVDVGDGSSSGDAELDTDIAAGGPFQDDDTVHIDDMHIDDMHVDDGDPVDPLPNGLLDGGQHGVDPHEQIDDTHFDNL